MKEILLIHHRLPYPLTSGMDKLRFNLLVTLSKRYMVTLAVPMDTYTKPEWIESVRCYAKELVIVPVKRKEILQRKGIAAYLFRLMNLILFRTPSYSTVNYYKEFKNQLVKLTGEKQFYFIQILSDFSACYLQYLPRNQFTITGPMDDTIQLTHQSCRLTKKATKKIGLKFLYRATIIYFSQICRRSNMVLFHSVEDLNRVKSTLGFDFRANVLPVPTDIFDKAQEPYEDIEPNSLVFVGGLGTVFNQDAAIHLVNDILPIIRKNVPDVKLYLVGNNPPTSILKYGENKNIIVTGEVHDVRPFIKKASVYVSSVRIGTGIKTKIIEALSMSKAIVVSSASLQGLWEKDDSVFVTDDNIDFAEKVVSLLQNSELRKQQEKKSAQLFNKAYSFSKVESLTLASYENFEKEFSKSN